MFSWYRPAQEYLIAVQLIFAMFGMGATLGARDFLLVLKHPKGLLTGLGLQWILVPVLGQLVIVAFGLSPGWAVGIVLICVIPGGAYSNLLTFLGRGNTALSISVTLITTLGCIVTVPLLLQLLASAHLPPSFSMPVGAVIFKLVFYLLLPMLVGMIVFRFWRDRADALSVWSIRASVALILLIVVGALGSGQMKVIQYGLGPPAILIGFAIALHFLSAEACWLLRRPDDETVALAIEVSVRNGGLALALISFFFAGRPEQGHVLYAVLFFSGFQLFAALPTLLRHRAGKSALFFRKPRARAPTDP